MDDRHHLHEGERLLCAIRPGASLLVRGWARAVLDALVGGVLLLVLLAAVWWFLTEGLPPAPLLAVPFLLVLVVSCALRWRVWASASFRVTTERLLLDVPATAFATELTTIKWMQYQESHAGKGGLLDLLLRTKPLSIRYGTADTEREAVFPALPMAKDLKHYLDKVDAALRQNAAQEIRPFVAKKKGERD